jgi:hypothetical protein
MFGLNPQLISLIGVVGLAVALLVAWRFKAVMLVFGGLLLTASLAAPVDWQGDAVQTWMTPVQSRRSELFAACGVFLVMSMVLNLGRMKFLSLPLQGLCVVALALYAGVVRLMIAGDFFDGLNSIILALVTLLPGVVIARSLYEDKEDVLWMLRVLASVSIIWVGCCAVQFVVRAKVLTLAGGGRFQGMLSNPQHAGVLLAFLAALSFFLLVNDRKYVFRPLWAVLAGTNVALLLWTQSRTGFGMLVIMSMAIFYARLGAAIIFLPIAGLFFVGVASVIGVDIGEVGFGRFTRGGDTRTKVWEKMWEQFTENPLFGAGSQQDAVHSENSFLLGLASYGIVMGGLIILLAFATGWQVLRVLRLRGYLQGLERRLAELYVGFCGAYFAGALLEGYIVSRVSAPLVLMVIFSGIGGWLVEIGQRRHAEALHAEPIPSASDTWLAEQGSPEDFDAADEYAGYGDESFHSALSDSRRRLDDSRARDERS